MERRRPRADALSMTPLLVSLTVTLPAILTALGGIVCVIRRQGVCRHRPPHDDLDHHQDVTP